MNEYTTEEIKLRFKKIMKLGKGAFGEVHMVNEISSGNTFALKKIQIQKLNESLSEPSTCERHVLRYFKDIYPSQLGESNYLVKIHDWFRLRDSLGIDYFCYLMDYYSLSLNNLIKTYSNEKHPFSINFILKFVHDIASGLELLKSYNISHRDLKPGNIMIGDDNYFKMIDMGECTVNFEQTLTADNTLTGTFFYMAPEIRSNIHYLDRMSINTFKSDVYSLGLIILKLALLDKDIEFFYKYEFSMSKAIYEEMLSQFMEIVSQRYENAKLVSVLRSMLQLDPDKRPAIESVKGVLFGGDDSIKHFRITETEKYNLHNLWTLSFCFSQMSNVFLKCFSAMCILVYIPSPFSFTPNGGFIYILSFLILLGIMTNVVLALKIRLTNWLILSVLVGICSVCSLANCLKLEYVLFFLSFIIFFVADILKIANTLLLIKFLPSDKLGFSLSCFSFGEYLGLLFAYLIEYLLDFQKDNQIIYLGLSLAIVLTFTNLFIIYSHRLKLMDKRLWSFKSPKFENLNDEDNSECNTLSGKIILAFLMISFLLGSFVIDVFLYETYFISKVFVKYLWKFNMKNILYLVGIGRLASVIASKLIRRKLKFESKFLIPGLLLIPIPFTLIFFKDYSTELKYFILFHLFYEIFFVFNRAEIIEKIKKAGYEISYLVIANNAFSYIMMLLFLNELYSFKGLSPPNNDGSTAEKGFYYVWNLFAYGIVAYLILNVVIAIALLAEKVNRNHYNQSVETSCGYVLNRS